MKKNCIWTATLFVFLALTNTAIAQQDAALLQGEIASAMDSRIAGQLNELRAQNSVYSRATNEENESDFISDYETDLPHASQPRISRYEARILAKYLDDPTNAELAKFLGYYHAFFVIKHKHRAKRKTASLIKRAIYATYFLQRAQHLGDNDRWAERIIRRLNKKLNSWLPSDLPLDLSEGNHAHQFFLDAFNYDEANRYRAANKLMRDLVKNPTNLTTNAYVIASNIWNAGEADFSDPTILYNMLLSSYFSERTLPLYQRAEQNWVDDPENNELYRLSTLLGGWSVPARRWLAQLHGDDDIVAALDDEHRQWFQINPFFHSASVGWMFFDEPENLLEGFQTTFSVFGCTENRACMDRPRFSFNLASYTLFVIDYFLKVGDTDTASMFLTFKFNPFFNYDSWLLGQDAWEHRENNMMEIVARYQNDDPTDDPTTASLKSHQWGPNTITCQLCHQAQAREWSQEERATIFHPTDSDGFVGNWPDPVVRWDALFKP